MAQILEFFKQIASPTLQDVEDARELEVAVSRFCLVLEEARKTSEQLRQRRA